MRRLTITLSEDQYVLLKENSERNRRSLSAEVNMAIDEWVGIHEPSVLSGNLENVSSPLYTKDQPEDGVRSDYNDMNGEARKFLDGHKVKVTESGLEESEVSRAIKEFGIDKVLEINKADNELEFNELNSAARAGLRNDLKFCSSRADVERLVKKYKLSMN